MSSKAVLPEDKDWKLAELPESDKTAPLNAAIRRFNTELPQALAAICRVAGTKTGALLEATAGLESAVREMIASLEPDLPRLDGEYFQALARFLDEWPQALMGKAPTESLTAFPDPRDPRYREKQR